MDLLTAHGLLAMAADQGRVSRWPAELRLAATAPLEMCAAAHLSGWLPDADTEEEVVDAALHGITLIDIGVAYRAAYERAIDEVLAALHREVCALSN